MEKHSEKSCLDFSKMLASKNPVPGGGGASALAGALGAALCAMVANYTIGKPKYSSVEAEVTTIRNQAEEIRMKLLKLMDADAEAFISLSDVYAMPKTEAARREKLETATLNACDAPLGMIEACCQALELLRSILEKGNRMLLSDTGCGAILCKAAMESASMNVYVNTKTLQDRDKAAQINESVAARIEKYGLIADRIIESVREQLTK